MGSRREEAETPHLCCSFGTWNFLLFLFGLFFETFYLEITIDSEVAKVAWQGPPAPFLWLPSVIPSYPTASLKAGN